MKCFYLLALVALCLLPAPARADKITVARTVLLPDGKPAAGARVTVRTFARDGAVSDETQTVTGKDGSFKVQVEAPIIAKDANSLVREGSKWVRQTLQFTRTGYILVDVPGAPLLLGGLLPEDFNPQTEQVAPAPPPTIRIATTGYALGGKVQTAAGKPLPRVPVKVKWNYSRNFQFGSMSCRDSVPVEFSATTAADGAFKLRPVATVDRDTETNVSEPSFVTAETVVDTVAWHGGAVFFPPQKSNFLPASVTTSKTMNGNGAEPIISLYPTVTARGRIVDAATGKPLAGVSIRPYKLSISYPDSIFNSEARTVTDKNGFWKLWSRADSNQQALYASTPGFMDRRISIDWHSLRQIESLQSLQAYDIGVLSLKPIVTLKGKVIDEETRETLAGPALVYGADVEAGYSEDAPRMVPDDSQQSANPWSGSPRTFRGVRLNAQGLFSLETAGGPNAIRFDSPLYKMVDTKMAVDVPMQGLENLEIKVHKHPAYFVQLAVADAGLKNRLVVRVRPPGDTSSGSRGTYAPSGYWAWNAPQWGNKAEIQVLLLDKAPENLWSSFRLSQVTHDSPSHELLSWTTITADPQNWPLVIQVPAAPKTAVP